MFGHNKRALSQSQKPVAHYKRGVLLNTDTRDRGPVCRPISVPFYFPLFSDARLWVKNCCFQLWDR